jgi:hypothetical protein
MSSLHFHPRVRTRYKIRKNISISKVKDTKIDRKTDWGVSKVFYQSEGIRRRRRRRGSLAVRLW